MIKLILVFLLTFSSHPTKALQLFSENESDYEEMPQEETTEEDIHDEEMVVPLEIGDEPVPQIPLDEDPAE